MALFLVKNGTVRTGKSSGEMGAQILTSQETGRKLAQIQERIDTSFLYEADGEMLSAGLFKGMMLGLDDPYANYYTTEELKSIVDSSEGEYYGIGITMLKEPESGRLHIMGIYEGSPAWNAGMQVDDEIVKVGDTDVTDMDLSSAIALIKEQKDGVELTAMRGQEEKVFSMKLASVVIPTVSSRMVSETIGYLKISEFDGVTVGQFGDAVAELSEQGMEKLIVDVRDNPGGNLDSVCDILDQLLPEGLIVYTEDKNGNREERKSDEEQKFEHPVAVLVNGNSASASEIFAGAIQDYKMGPVVGTQTYGKGVVQRTYLLDDGSAVKLTTEKYFTPGGQDIDGQGIMPDVVVEEETPEEGGAESKAAESEAAESEGTESEAADTEADVQLQAAIDALNE